MSNTGHKWIYKINIPRLKNSTRYRVRVYYGCENIDVGFCKTLEEAIEIRNQYMRDNGIGEEVFKHYKRRENGDKS